MGHNGRIAWTFTTTGADTQDVFIETPLDNGTYATPDGPQSFTVRAERIAVRGQPDDVFQVRETRHGPVLSDLDRVEGGPVLAVAMANLEPGDAATGLAALNRATTLDEAARAAAQITSPVQNLLVADRTRIAQFTTGRIPLRRAGDGTLPVPGADGAHDWTGFAQGAALPQVIDPPSGRLVNANERTAGPDFPVFMGQDWFSDWRARRIRQLLAAQPKHSLAGFAAMQADSGSSFATQILPRLLMVPSADAASAHVLAMLRNWDGGMRVDQPQPLLFNAWMRQFQVDVLRRIDLPDGAAGPMTDFVGQVLSPSGALLCGGDCTALLAGSLKTAVAGLEAQYGTGWDSVPWGQVHQAVFAHPLLGQIPGLAWLTTFRVAQAGDDSTVFRGSMRAPGWESVHGPGYRGVYDLAELDRSLFVVAPGQSGNPLRHTAASLLRRWRDGFPVQLGPQPNEITDTIGLRP